MDIVIPETFTSIARDAFFASGIQSVVIPDSVTSIGTQAFRDNQLTSVVIPDGVTSIGSAAFFGNQLTSIAIPDGVTSIGVWAFRGNQIESVVIPSSVVEIFPASFDQNVEIIFSDDLIGDEAPSFIDSSLQLQYLTSDFSDELSPASTGALTALVLDDGTITYGPADSTGLYGSLAISADGITTYTGETAAITSQTTSTLTDTFSVTATNGTATSTADYVVSIANPTAENSLLIEASASGSIDGIAFGSTATTGAYAGTLLNAINLGAAADTATITDPAGTTAALTLNGGDGFDRLNGNASANTLTLTDLDRGTLDQVSFTSIENIFLEDGDDIVVINAGGRLSGILDGGAGNNTLQVDPSLGITINDNGSITVGGGGSAGGSSGTFSGFQSVQVGTGSSSSGSTSGSGNGSTPATNTITLNANSNVALITGPNSGTVDGTGFTNISDINLAAGDDNAVLAATGSLTGTLDGGSGTADSLTVNAEANILNINQSGNGSIGTDGNTIATSITGFEAIRLDAGNDIANLNVLATTAAASRTALLVDGGADDDTLNLTLSEEELDNLQSTGQLSALQDYIAAPQGQTISIELLETSLTLQGFEAAVSSQRSDNSKPITVRSPRTVTLNPEEDNLILTGDLEINGTGNSRKNLIVGNNANNILDGKAGIDRLKGKDGDDIYIVDNKKDKVIERLGQGNDTIQSSVSTKTRANIENLLLTGSKALKGAGNDENNLLEGNAGNNQLKGKAGNDTLIGNSGKDNLSGGGDDDTFVYRSTDDSGTTKRTRDKITDFQTGDTIDLSQIDANTTVLGDQAFTFIGSANFSAAGQVRFINEILSVNTDDDLGADLQVQLKGVSDLFVESLVL